MIKWSGYALALMTALLLPAIPGTVSGAVALVRTRAAHTNDACMDAGTATNAVVRFYLAVDRRQLGAAYGCLAPSEQAQLPYTTFLQGYAHTRATRLLTANGDAGITAVPTPMTETMTETMTSGVSGTAPSTVTVTFEAVDTSGDGLVARRDTERWRVDASNRLALGILRPGSASIVRAVPTVDVSRVLTDTGQQTLALVHADVTADRASDDIYLTSGTGCGSCHSQQILIYSRGRLVFAERVDNGEVRVARGGGGFEVRATTPGSSGPDCCPSARTYEEWAWTSYGFALRGRRIVRSHGA